MHNIYNKRIKDQFSISGYKKILKEAKKNYKLTTYENIGPNKIVLRHDIDLDLELALKFAEIENKMQIKSYYFLMINNNLYNLFSKRSKEIVQKILKFGHIIGLHHDISFYKSKSIKNIKNNINCEIKFFNKIFNYKIYYVSFHRPNKQFYNFDFKDKNFKSVYSKDFFSKDIKYISDSGATWKEDDLYYILRNKKFKKMQILVHPEFWFFSKKKSLNERINKILDYKKFIFSNLAQNEINDDKRKIYLYKNENRNIIKPY